MATFRVKTFDFGKLFLFWSWFWKRLIQGRRCKIFLRTHYKFSVFSYISNLTSAKLTWILQEWTCYLYTWCDAIKLQYYITELHILWHMLCGAHSNKGNMTFASTNNVNILKTKQLFLISSNHLSNFRVILWHLVSNIRVDVENEVPYKKTYIPHH